MEMMGVIKAAAIELKAMSVPSVMLLLRTKYPPIHNKNRGKTK